MKFQKLLCLVIAATAISCSDTNVVTGDETGNGNGNPIVEGKFSRRVLIEDFTGTWCGNCTRVAQGIENVNAQTDKAVVVGVHHGNDPYHYNGIEPLRALIYPDFPDFPLPTVRLNRLTTWTFPEPSNTQQVLNLITNDAGLGLAMKSSLIGNTLNLDVKIKFAESYSDLKLVVYLLEDNLVYNQVNYVGSYQNGQNPIQNFEHDHVLRESLTNILGDPVTGELVSGNTITRNFTIPVPASVDNAANMNFVAFVVGADNKAINSRAALLNEDQSFEQNP